MLGQLPLSRACTYEQSILLFTGVQNGLDCAQRIPFCGYIWGACQYVQCARAHTHTHPNKLRIGGRITEKGALQFIHMTLEHTGQDVASCMRVCEGQDLEHRYELAVGAGEVASALILYGVLLGQAQ